MSSTDIARLKNEILQLGASLDRGQSYNPTSGDYYKDKMEFARQTVMQLTSYNRKTAQSLSDIAGEWELVFSTVPHGIFRSSPFFLAIQEAYNREGQGDKAQLFFKLHELQTMSWGISKIGRVAQVIETEPSSPNNGIFISEFDTSIFSLTTIPILGWFKLLPTFGGTVVTVSNATVTDGTVFITVDYTTSRPVPGLQGLSDEIWSRRVPVNAIW